MQSNSPANGRLEMFCVFYVDMESSTYNTACLRPEDYSAYYGTFYDTLSGIAQKFGGRVIKHIGDALIIYFPATSDPKNEIAFRSTIDCGMAMLEAQGQLNNALQEQNLPAVCYRISADYGRMEPIETETSPTLDWIGPSMNMVAKMNHLAHTNSMVIGGDLHQLLSQFSFQEYLLEFATELNIGIKQKYPIYSVRKRKGYDVLSISSKRTRELAIVPEIHLNKNGGSAKELVLEERVPNILIVDDEHDILLTFKQFLIDQRVNVDVFADPAQLLGQLAAVGPTYYDLAILDIKMPKMTGFQVYQLLTALKPNIKTLFISALDYADEVLSVLRGIDKEHDFIKKPVDRENFLVAVSKKINLNA